MGPTHFGPAQCGKKTRLCWFNVILDDSFILINHVLVDSQLNYVGVRIYQCIRMIKQSKMCPLGGATFWNNHLPAVNTILTPFLVCLKPEILPIRWCHFL